MKNLFLFLFVLILALSPLAPAEAQDAPGDDTAKISSFQSYKILDGLNLTVPTVVELPFDTNEKIGFDIAVMEPASMKFLPWYLNTVSSSAQVTSTEPNLVDGKTKTTVEYNVPEEGLGLATLNFSSETAITSTSIQFTLDPYVALPTTIKLSILDEDGSEKTIIANSKMTSTHLNFPSTTAKEWKIELGYSQYLRISEVELEQSNQSVQKSLRFLAQPGSDYTLYFNADTAVSILTTESGDLTSNIGVKVLTSVASQTNPLYKKTDTDEDGIPNESDNCTGIQNPEQSDENQNGRGNECDDYDRDGKLNVYDNCPNEPNKWQEDEDGDKIGDICDDEESRPTEQYPWLPWTGLGAATLIIGLLFYKTARKI